MLSTVSCAIYVGIVYVLTSVAPVHWLKRPRKCRTAVDGLWPGSEHSLHIYASVVLCSMMWCGMVQICVLHGYSYIPLLAQDWVSGI